MSPGISENLEIASRVFRKGGLPVSLIFFVTSKCNLLCKHCFYWEELNQRKNELSLKEIQKVAISLPNLLTVSLTGGEPYLRKDLPEIAEAFETHSRVRNIQIPSNGFLVERTIKGCRELLGRVRRARVATGVSLDGPEEIHNEVRQNPKSFARALETFHGLKSLKTEFENLSVGVALTVSAANQDLLDDFFDFVSRRLEPDAMTITLTRGRPIDPSLKKVDPDLYRRFARKVIDYRRAHALNGFSDRLVIAKEEATYQLISEAAEATSRISPCYAGELIGILSETGEVHLCETLDRSMGNVREFNCDVSRLWSSREAREARQYQKDLQCQCSYECAMSMNTLFNPKTSRRILRRALLPVT